MSESSAKGTAALPTDTPEQAAIKMIRNGFHVVSANAGTGKTHTLAELIVLLYLAEAKKIEDTPRGEGETPESRQEKILRQILAITFTRDAARELDDRIWARLAALGIPELKTKWGHRYRICRTIDSFIRDWMRRPLVLRKLLRVDPDILGSLREKLGKMSPEVQEALKLEVKKAGKPTGRRAEAEIGLFRQWPWLRMDKVSDLIFDALHRGDDDQIVGVNSNEWQDAFDVYLAALPPPARGGRNEDGEYAPAWASNFWHDKVEAWSQYQHEMRGLNERNARGELAGGADRDKHHLALKVWEKHQAARKEFFAVLEIARSRGYHPVRAPKKLAGLAVLQELAACQHWDDFVHFHTFALEFYAAKMRFGVMDFADFLIACVDTFELHPDLLERDVEYPRFGIRAKYVLYDEVQDNSVSNNSLFRVLCGKSTTPYLGVAVGDAKQAIYGFRGACSYGFGQMIQSVQKNRPENIHHLTCSFRSLAKIVALGNECVMTLPDYKDGVHPSHTVYQDPGEVIIAPPMRDEMAESDWVVQRVRELLYDTNETVMVLHRNNLRDHPIVPSLKEFAADYPGRFSTLTIHRSKGLQAHHVFLMGMSATLMPDVRTSYTQMVNLLYVGLTRPRKALYITAPFTIRKTNTVGELETKDVGPSPFIYHIPSLRDAAERAGWPLEMLKKGEDTTEQAARSLSARISGKDAYLRRQWRQLWRDIPIKEDEGDEYSPETGGAEPDPKIKLLTRRSLYEDGKLVLNSAPRLGDGIRERVVHALKKAYAKNGQAPRLSKDEYIFALKAGWISRVEGSRFSEITPTFVEQVGQDLAAR